MRIRVKLLGVLSGAALALLVRPALGQAPLYTQSFDVDDTANWIINPGNPDFSMPGATTPVTTATNVFFDYSSVGIPSAPNSTSGSTRGLQLRANIKLDDPDYNGIFGGYSVSPMGQNFTGDYSLKFDLWANYVGTFDEDPPMSGGVGISATGASMLSQYGIMTAGDFSNSPGFVDAVYFAHTGDGGSGADYRIYSVERAISYQIPGTTPEDEHAVHLAGSRNNTAQLYIDSFGGATVPAAQTALTNYDYNGSPRDLSETQYGVTPAGTLGFEWHRVEVKKEGFLVSWLVDDVLLATVDTTEFIDTVGGGNILFGHADINGGLSLDPNYEPMMFTLIDNIQVTALGAAGEDADFDGDGDVDGADFLAFQRGFGISDGTAQPVDGDATGDGNVDGADFQVFQNQFGETAGASGAAAAVPEPATWGLVVVAAAVYLALIIPRRRAAVARVGVGRQQ